MRFLHVCTCCLWFAHVRAGVCARTRVFSSILVRWGTLPAEERPPAIAIAIGVFAAASKSPTVAIAVGIFAHTNLCLCVLQQTSQAPHQVMSRWRYVPPPHSYNFRLCFRTCTNPPFLYTHSRRWWCCKLTPEQTLPRLLPESPTRKRWERPKLFSNPLRLYFRLSCSRSGKGARGPEKGSW